MLFLILVNAECLCKYSGFMKWKKQCVLEFRSSKYIADTQWLPVTLKQWKTPLLKSYKTNRNPVSSGEMEPAIQ